MLRSMYGEVFLWDGEADFDVVVKLKACRIPYHSVEEILVVLTCNVIRDEKRDHDDAYEAGKKQVIHAAESQAVVNVDSLYSHKCTTYFSPFCKSATPFFRT